MSSNTPPPEGFVSVHQIAEQLGEPLHLVRRAIKTLALEWLEHKEPKKRGLPVRLYPQEAVESISQEITRLRRPRERNRRARDERATFLRASAASRLLRTKASALSRLAESIQEALRHLPLRLNVVLHSLPDATLELVHPLSLEVLSYRATRWHVSLADLDLGVTSTSKKLAIGRLLKELVAAYLALEADPSADPERWRILRQLVRRSVIDPVALAKTDSPHPAEAPPPPTFVEWLHHNTPHNLNQQTALAWRRGASAYYRGRTTTSYTTEAYIQAWQQGYRALAAYLSEGGRLACSKCRQPLSRLPVQEE